MRVWVDVTNTAHVLVLRPLVEELEARGHDVLITARPLSHTVELLEDWGHDFHVLGAYGGSSRPGKAQAAADRVVRMLRFGRRRRFDWALAHGSTDLPPVARALGVPNTTMFDYEWAVLQHSLNCRLANRVLVPEAIPPDRLRRYGARGRKLVRYPGLKEEYYLDGFTPDRGLLDRLGVGPDDTLVVVRTAPAYALYLGGHEPALMPSLLARLDAAEGVRAVVLTRTAEQADGLRSLGLRRLVIPGRAVDGRSLVALADVLVSAGGTMNREAAVLGTPVWSMFEGPPGAIDELLLEEGRLRMLRDPADVVLRPKQHRMDGAFAGRKPADLLALAVPPAAGVNATRR